MVVKRKGSLAQALQKRKPLNSRLRVGFIDGATYTDGTNVATVAFWNEYGSDKSPPRPFMRNTFADKKSQWTQLAIGLYRAYGEEKMLMQLGEVMVGDIQQSIVTFTNPPNSAYTIKKKGFNAPLRDTMLMSRSLSYELSDDGK